MMLVPLGPGEESRVGLAGAGMENEKDRAPPRPVPELQREVLSGETLVASDPFTVTQRCKCSFPCPVVLTPQGQDEAGKWDPEQNRRVF